MFMALVLVRLPPSVRVPPPDPTLDVIVPVFVIVPDHSSCRGLGFGAGALDVRQFDRAGISEPGGAVTYVPVTQPTLWNTSDWSAATFPVGTLSLPLPWNTNVPAAPPFRFNAELFASSTGAEPGEPAPTLKTVPTKANVPDASK